ncbi:unnamed protein product [Discosporangium mesarthrocarpum]
MVLALLGMGIVGLSAIMRPTDRDSHLRRMLLAQDTQGTIMMEGYTTSVVETTEDDVSNWWSKVEYLPPGKIEGLPNILFIKPHKVGSSSMSTFVRLVAARNGGIRREYMYTLHTTDYFYAKKELQPLEEGLHIWGDHESLSDLLGSGGLPEIIEESFKVTLVRDPLNRCFSSFYYYDIERQQVDIQTLPTEELTRLKVKSEQSRASFDGLARVT